MPIDVTNHHTIRCYLPIAKRHTILLTDSTNSHENTLAAPSMIVMKTCKDDNVQVIVLEIWLS